MFVLIKYFISSHYFTMLVHVYVIKLSINIALCSYVNVEIGQSNNAYDYIIRDVNLIIVLH